MMTFREFKDSKEEKREEKAVAVIRKGMNIRKDSDFWDDFLSLCGDSSGMAALLDVPVEKVTALGGRIGRLVRLVEDEDSGVKKNSKLIKTGGEV